MRIRFLAIIGGLMGLLFSGGAKAAEGSAHQFSFESIEGLPLPLKDFSGKVLLVVNTASNCGFTAQYEDLQALYARYQDKGLVVIGVPSNDFGAQEPGTAEQIKDFCDSTFSVTFPMTQKYSVSGDEAHEFYRWANDKAGLIGRPRWNFHKYLIGPDGSFKGWYSTVTSPNDSKVVSAIETLLASTKTGTR
jgi:glutathione peroxidase